MPQSSVTPLVHDWKGPVIPMERRTAVGCPRGMPGVLEFPCTAVRLPNGNTLIADAGDEIRAGSEIIEVDPTGQIVWNYSDGLLFAHSAVRTKDGNTLVADTTNDRVIEISPDGQIVFSTDDLDGGAGTLSDGSHLHYPNSAVELDQGAFLITDRNNDRCIILDRHGHVRWFYNTNIRRLHSAEMLDNGNVLTVDSDGNRIVEVSQGKQVVWTYGNGSSDVLYWPRHARRLANGNTLVTDSKNARVLEVTPNGNTAWSHQVDYLSKFYYAEKLPNGNVLISDQQRHQVYEIDPGGTVVWLYRNYVYPNIIFPRLTNGQFQERDDDMWPEGWILVRRLSEGGGEIIWDEETGQQPSPGISYDRSGVVCLQQTVRVKPRARYWLSGWIRTEEVDGIACLQMSFVDHMGAAVHDAPDIPRGKALSGTTGWVADAFGATAPAQATVMEVRLFLTGKAWMSGLRLTS